MSETCTQCDCETDEARSTRYGVLCPDCCEALLTDDRTLAEGRAENRPDDYARYEREGRERHEREIARLKGRRA